jgi:nucleoid-associated protein YgaU
MSFARAHLLVEGGSRISFWFNPTTLQRERRASYNSCQAVGQAAPTLEYLGTAAESLSLNLLLHAQDGTSGDDVNNALAALDALIKPKVNVSDTKQQRPRTVQLVWGQYTSRVSVCESVNTTIELFDYDGTPLRALVAIRLVQAKPEPGDGGQNPTTRATQQRRSHLVHAGDTLAGIAFAHYGDPTRWRAIALANDVDDPLRLRAGEHLTVPLEAR